MKCSVLGFALCAASAHASFDMLLVANGADNRIYRHDPVSNVALGSFELSAAPIDIAVNQAANEVYVLTAGTAGTGVLRYDYNTGAFKSSTVLAGAFGAAKKLQFTSTGELLVSYARDVVRYNPLTGAQIGSAIFYSDRRFLYNGGAAYAGGLYHLNGESDGAWSFDYVLGMLPNNNIVSSLGSATSYDVHSWQDIVANSSGSAVLIAETVNSTTLSFGKFNATGSGLFATGIGFSMTGTGMAAQACEWGHGSMAYALYNVSAGNLVYQSLETNLGVTGTLHSIPGFTNSSQFRGSAIVVAPEPVSFLAFAAGTLLLLRRRK